MIYKAFPLGVAMFCLVASGLTHEAKAQAQETPKRGGTAIFSIGQDPQGVNPDTSVNPPDRLIGCTTYEGLVNISPDYKILPLLVKSWAVTADGLTYTFELKDVDWHDGKKLTAEDVKYTLLEVATKYSPVFAPSGRAIESIDASVPTRVVVKLKQPFGPFMISLTCTQGAAILPSHLLKGTDPLKNKVSLDSPVGTGSFKLAEWKRGDFVRMTRNEKYHQPGKPYLDAVIAKVIPTVAGRLNALQAGEIDLHQYFPGHEIEAVQKDPKLKIERSDASPGINLLAMNVNRKPFDDVRVRRGLFMAVDRDYIFKNAFFSVGGVGLKPYTSDIPWAANPDIDFSKMYPYDIAKANAMLDETDFKRGADGKRGTVHIAVFATQYPEFQQAALAIKSMWQAIGVDVVMDALEDTNLIKTVYVDRNFDIMIHSGLSFSDPALGLARAFVTSSIGKPFGNPTGYSNPEVDKLFEDGERGTDFDERGKFYKQAQVILARDLPAPMLRQFFNIDGASKRLKGLWGKAQGNGTWSDAWLDQ